MGLDSVREFVATADPLWQWLAVAMAAAIPYVESYLGAAIGTLAGVPPVLAIIAAIAGNLVSMLAAVGLADRVRRRRNTGTQAPASSARRVRLKRAFDRFGVPGVSLLGQTLLPSQLTSMAMVGFGADTRTVIIWQVISIVIWGTAFGSLAAAGLYVVA